MHMIILLLDNSPLTLHCCSLFVNYDSNHFSSIRNIQNCLFILFSEMRWFIKSNAFLIYRNTTPFITIHRPYFLATHLLFPDLNIGVIGARFHSSIARFRFDFHYRYH